jgi:hypothetical protein
MQPVITREQIVQIIDMLPQQTCILFVDADAIIDDCCRAIVASIHALTITVYQSMTGGQRSDGAYQIVNLAKAVTPRDSSFAIVYIPYSPL